jgi:hypothetical protein
VVKKRKWTKLNDYCMQSGEWRVSKAFVDGTTLYSVWTGNEKSAAGHVESFQEAQELIDELEAWVEDYEKCLEKESAPIAGATQ